MLRYSAHSERLWNRVELIEPVMVAQAERFPLDLEVPAVLHRPAAELTIGGELLLPIGAGRSRHPAA